VVRKADENGNVKTMVEKRSESANVAEANAFQEGKKPVLVFSEAGGTGRSYHADNGAASASKRRSHYLVQPGWRADKAVQGFGRTHRTNQASAPIFHLVTTDLQGQRRFISSIARRLAQLGALTKGERRTGDQGLFGLKDNLESGEAGQALKQFYRDVHRGDVEGVSMPDLEKGMGLKLTDEQTGALRAELPPMSQFLNRLLSLKIDDQNKVFNAFSERFDTVVDRAAAAGTLDTGVETFKADKIEKKADQVVYTDPSSGAETRHVHLITHTRNRPIDFQTVNRLYPQAQYVRNQQSGRVYAATKANGYTDANGAIVDQHRLVAPTSYQFIDTHKLNGGNWQFVDSPAEARAAWDQQVASTPEFSKSDLHMITGAVLPIWNRLGGSPRVYRLQTDAGERMLGRMVPNNQIAGTLDRLGAEKLKIEATPAEIAERVLNGDRAKLANDWTIKRSIVAGQPRLELIGPDYRYEDELKNDGVFVERIGYSRRYFIPTGDDASRVISDITKSRPITQLGEEGGGGAGGTELYAGPGALFSRQAWQRFFGPMPGGGPVRPNEILRDKQGIAKFVAEVKAGFAPTALRGAKPTEYAIRQHNAASAQAYDMAFHALEGVRAAVDRLSKDDQIEFTDRMETGHRQATPELQEVADTLRTTLDQWRDKVQSLGRGYLANAIEDYMGHIWSNYREWSQGQGGAPNQTQAMTGAIARNVRRQPLRGSGAFLKQRYFPTQKEGIDAGLIPVTYNPVDLQLIKIHEMQKFYHGTTLADRMKQEGIARWVPSAQEFEAERDGKVKLDDRVFQPKLYGVSRIGPVEPGAWYAWEPAARVFNNYMSEGWYGRSSIYEAARRTNNLLNSAQLSMSGFHASFVGLDMLSSKLALGLQQMGRALPELRRGEVSKAAGHATRGAGNALLGSAPLAPATWWRTTRLGGDVLRAWMDPANATPEMRQIVDMVKAGGGRAKMPEFFRAAAAGSFFRSWADIKNPSSAFHQAAQMFRDAPTPFQKAIATPFRIAARLVDTSMEPIMGALVPRAKLGVFADLASDWLRDHPTATPAETSEAMTKFWDSVDNRLGQLNYDNLFWHKNLKDTAFLMTRSVGWNLGTVRELAGAGVDTAAALRDTLQGRPGPKFTTRMAYAIAMTAVTAQVGAILTYLFTGKGPQSPMDYFYPPTGGNDNQGQPERLAIPGYTKDVIAFSKAPLQTALNKTAPLPEAAQELVKNRDYYGDIIYDPMRDQGMMQAYGDYLLMGQLSPFAFRAINRMQHENTSLGGQAMGFFGFQPAPSSITNPARQERYEQRQEKRAFKQRERNVSKGLTGHIFNHPSGSP
jgi:hypothetical protein